MGILKMKIDEVTRKARIIREVLAHFDKPKNSHVTEIVSAAVDFAQSDALLFEEFELWHEDRDDKAFIHRIEHFLEVRSQMPLPKEKRDITHNIAATEEIKVSARAQTKKRFADWMNELSLKHNLLTSEKLADYLDIDEETARRMKLGDHKPQMKTLKKIADKFNISIEEILKRLFS